MVQDFQRGHQFAAEEAGAAPLPGEGGERLDDAEIAGAGAEAGFQAPDAGDDSGADAVALLDTLEQRTVGSQRLAAVDDAFVGDDDGRGSAPRSRWIRVGDGRGQEPSGSE